MKSKIETNVDKLRDRYMETGKAKLKDQLDNLIYGTFNCISNMLFLTSKNRKIVKENIKFKDLHYGKRCFVLGTGPSLNKVDLNLLKNEIVFGVNYFFRSELINLITPQYYCLYDEAFHTREKEKTIEMLKKLPNTTFFLRSKAYDFINSSYIEHKDIYYQHCGLVQHSDLVRLDMTKNMTAPFNVVLGCLQTAIYMGFKEIYLLGCDFNSFANLKVEHCYQDESSERIMSMGFELKYFSLISYHHYAIERYAKRNNIRIYNLTPNSLLDAYERNSLENIL